MYIARILYPVEVLGPGRRIGIWFSGCPRRCKGCSNPELWDFNEKQKTSLETVMDLIMSISSSNQVDGFTITGGDPLYQPEELQSLIRQLSTISDDILLYTGYKSEEISKEYLTGVAVLIDGEYIEELNTNCFLKGSENQRIIIINDRYKSKYERYLAESTNKIQNFVTSDGIISVGIHKPDFLHDLELQLSNYGLEKPNNS